MLPCWLLICTVLQFLKGRGWEGTLGLAWVLSAVLPPFLWVFGWLVGGWVVGLFVFFGIMLLPMLLLVNNRMSVYTSVC